MNETPYYETESGTMVYGSNRAGHSAWQMFDRKVAEALLPIEHNHEIELARNTQLVKDFIKYLAIGLLGGPIVFIILYHHMNFVPNVVAWLVFALMVIGVPIYGMKQIKDEIVARNSKTSIDHYYKAQSSQRYTEIVSQARQGILDKSMPGNIRSWAIGAMSEEKIGSILENLGHGYEVSHDITILQNGQEVANIDHLVSTRNGIVMVDSKSWSGTVTVDQSTGELTSGQAINDDYRRKAIHSLRHEAHSLNLPLRAVVVAVDNGHVIGVHNGEKVEGIARILDDNSFDTYIVEASLLGDLMNLLSQDGQSLISMQHIEQMALSRGSEVRF